MNPTQRQQTPQPATTAIRETQPAADFERLLLQDSKTEVKFKAFASDTDVRLSIPLVKKYIAVAYPYKEQNGTVTMIEPSDQECAKFIFLCRARQLDPYEQDAYMIPFFDNKLGKPVWSLITAYTAFLKRAEVSDDYDGMESGIIVQNSAKVIEYREGDFKHPGDTLLGGWANVYRKGQSRPNRKRVNFEVYSKPFGNWAKDPGGMICKVAEAQALRDSFPTKVGGLFLKEELEALANQEEAVTQPLKRPTRAGPGATAPQPPTPTPPTQAPEPPKAPESPVGAPGAGEGPEDDETQRQASAASEQGQNSASDEEIERNMGLGSAPAAQEPAKPAAQGSPAPVSDPAGAPAPVLTKPDYKPTEPFQARKDEIPELENVRYLLWKCGKTEEQLLPLLVTKRLCRVDQKLEHLSTKRLTDIAKAWDTTFLPELNKAQ